MPSPKEPSAQNSAADKKRAVPAPPQLSLPKGGGAIRGIDEKFSVNPATGAGSASIPLPLSPGRADMTPPLSLSYDSSAGNGPFGLGWSLALPSISRKTDKRLPRYLDDGPEADVFLLAGAEDLVPRLLPEGDGWKPDVFERDGHRVTRYLPRIDGSFSRIERWTRIATGDVHWRTLSGANVTNIFGATPGARLSDPADPAQVFRWMLEETRDDRGNVVRYEYKAEDGAGVDLSAPAERNRTPVNLYLKRALYANHTPFQAGDWRLQLVFDYGEHGDVPAPEEALAWPHRPDPFSWFRAGFELRTRRLCRRALMFHRFDELGPGWTLVRSTDFSYEEDSAMTKLAAATLTGHIREGASYRKKPMPPVVFTYAAAAETSLRELKAEELGPVDGHWVDLDGEGLSGRLRADEGAWYYRPNRGGGTFGPERLETAIPAGARLGEKEDRFMDLSGGGVPDLVTLSGPAPGVRSRAHGAWGPLKPFSSMPTLDWNDTQARFIDLDGDGRSDLLITENDVFRWHASLGADGFAEARTLPREREEEKGPALIFADQDQSIFLADMSGDGLTDLVRVRNGEICYWPNMGHGRFGSKVAMAGAPLFDAPEHFRQDRLRFSDVDGSGPSDILYLGRDGLRFWRNLSGNGWSAPQEIPFPDVDALAEVEVTDLFGAGTSCLVWASKAPRDEDRVWRCLDLTGGVKPHLLTAVRNNLGAETRIGYASSTRFYLEDLAAGRPWITRLPFPVHLVERVETYDHVTGSRFVTSYAYHHGYYDAPEREFRGFARVDQTDTEHYAAFQGAGLFPAGSNVLEAPLHVPPARTTSWFHTGAYREGETIARQCASEYFQGDVHPQAALLPDSILPEGLTTAERVEAVRVLKGSLLRQENYALDATEKEAVPYAVAEGSFQVHRVQPAFAGRPAVFWVGPAETVDFHYERGAGDPRVGHRIALEHSPYGQVLKTVSIGYPRRVPQFPEQAKLTVVLSEEDVLNVDDQDGWFRLGLPLEARSYEAVPPAPAGARYTPAELRAALSVLAPVPFEAPSAPGTLRLLARAQTLYLKNDLSAPLPPGQAESLALPFESRAAVFTPGLLAQAYEGRVTEPMMAAEAGYVFDDGLWWAPSGRQDFDPARFYLPIRFRDAFGNTASVFRDAYALLVERTETSQDSAFNNIIGAQNDYRTLSPALITDPNGNRTAARTDELGRVTASALMGKEGAAEGDTLDDPTLRMEYDLFSWMDAGRPVSVHSFIRESHGPGNARWREVREYSDGFNRVVQTKTTAEPETEGGPPRFVGTGRVVFNNKGKPVKQYEPFFSATAGYEDEASLAASGVTPVLHYDPLGRVVRSDLPNGTFSRTAFDPWGMEAWDANDTVLESLWYAQRGAPDPAAPEPADPDTRAAWLTARHANTPAVVHLDPLERPFLSVQNDGAGEVRTRTALDVHGNPVAVADHQGRTISSRLFDMQKTEVLERNMDAGSLRTFFDAGGKFLRSWDGRDICFRLQYDPLQRPFRAWVREPGGEERLVERTVYGESHPDGAQLNMRGKVHRHYDGAGEFTAESFDFKGNPLSAVRRLARDHTRGFHWSVLAGGETLPALESAAAPLLEEESFRTLTAYDATNRPTALTAPDGSVALPRYDARGLLKGMSVRLRGQETPTLFVQDLSYDAKGQRTEIRYGNGVRTDYARDPLTFRLLRLKTERPGTMLQDLRYAFDPVGNVLAVRDDAQQTVYFNNAAVDPSARYAYDALYRLIRAEGREHGGQGASPQVDHDDAPRMSRPLPGDAQALRRYAEEYEYDPSGNILRMVHTAVQGNWTRLHLHDPASNRLTATSRPGDPDGGASDAYEYDDAGHMTRMPHLQALAWDHRGQLREADLGGGGTAHYVYDSGGKRVRKVIETLQGLVKERIYVGGYELYRERQGGAVTLARESLHVMDDQRRLALVETQTAGAGPADPLIRYQLENHLGSASLELDAAGAVVSYEEYHPFGSTSYQSGRSAAEVSLKRYRYTGKERDEETSLYHHGARHYAPWLGRWTSPDPVGIEQGLNLFVYARDNPILFNDPDGNAPQNSIHGELGELIATQSLDAQGVSTFTNWSKHVNGNGFDFIAYDPKTKKVWFVDNKAYSSTISEVTSFNSSNYATNLADAKKFLEKSTSKEAIAALEALNKGNVEKVVMNAYSKGNAGFSSKLFTAGIKAFDVRLGRLFGTRESWIAAMRVDGFLTGARKFSSKDRVLGSRRGFATVGGLLFSIVAIGSTVYVISQSEDRKKAIMVAAGEFAIAGLVYRVAGGIGTIAVATLSLCSDNAQMQEECEKNDQVHAFMREHTPDAVTRWGWFGVFERFDPEIEKEVHDLLFNTAPIVLPEPPKVIKGNPPPGGVDGYTPAAIPSRWRKAEPPPKELFEKK